MGLESPYTFHIQVDAEVEELSSPKVEAELTRKATGTGGRGPDRDGDLPEKDCFGEGAGLPRLALGLDGEDGVSLDAGDLVDRGR